MSHHLPRHAIDTMSALVIYAAKVLTSAVVIVAISEIAKRSTAVAALVASLPLTSLLAFIWLYLGGTDRQKIEDLSTQIIWMVIPSLAFFVIFPLLLRRGIGFWLSMAAAAVVTAAVYGLAIYVARRLGVNL